jgi:hypothetical protein
MAGRRLLELDLRLNLLFFSRSYGKTLLPTLVPNAALVSDMLAIVNQLQMISAGNASVSGKTMASLRPYWTPDDWFDHVPQTIWEIPRKLGNFDFMCTLDALLLRGVEPGPILRHSDFEDERVMSTLDALLLRGFEPGPILRHSDFEDLRVSDVVEIKSGSLFDDNEKADPGSAKMTSLIEKTTSLKLRLSSLDAAFISSGPFRLMLTMDLEEHLVLDNEGYLRIYWDFETIPGSRLLIYDGHFILENYKVSG